MPYDSRLYKRFSLGRGRTSDDSIELGPLWQSIPIEVSPPLPRTYGSRDGLLPPEYENIFPPSSRLSSPSSGSIEIDSGEWKGWKLGARLCVVLVTAVLILNITVTTWASIRFGLDGGIGTMHRGTCSSIKKAGLWFHIAINLLSTLLLGASNYCMQCLCSPTRKEIDDAHARKDWLDIGIQSMRNLMRISRMRMALWILLALSSVPLHLMFNSAIFVSLTANEYTVVAVTQEFVNGSSWTLIGADTVTQTIISNMQKNASSYEILDQSDCIKEYGVDYLSTRRNAIVVVSDSNSTDPLLGYLNWNYSQPQNSWVCGTTLGYDMTLVPEPISDFDCSIPVALQGLDSDSWVMANETVEYCLSEIVADVCRLEFSAPVMIAVICCNLVKLFCMTFTIWRCKEFTMVTLGDAVASFLERPDRYTKGLCTLTKKEIEDGAWPDDPAPKRWSDRRNFRLEAIGLRRYLLSNAFCATAVIAVSILLRFAIQNTTTSSDLPTLWSLGFGAVSASSLIRWNHPLFGSPGLMKNVLLANSPQLVLSLLYVTYNRNYTCMSFSKEWNDFARLRRPLRVTSPRGSQRSTYFLSLPYTYNIPILTISVTSHWILSQSLFLVAIDVFNEQGVASPAESILTCGFSCIALIFLIALAWLVLLTGVGFGLRRYRAGIPLAGSCSAAISAACHPMADEADVALAPVKWGVVSVQNGIGHCALSGHYVSPPIPWRLYLGALGGG